MGRTGPLGIKKYSDKLMSSDPKLTAAQNLIARLRTNTGKAWPGVTKVLATGMNGIALLTNNTPPKVLKVAGGNATREINALKKLAAAGANFVPRVNGNFVTIRRNSNNNLKNAFFGKFYNFNNSKLTPESRVHMADARARRRAMTVYVMNKVGNGSLWSYVKSGRANNNNKRKIRADILRAIEFMHSHGISHGDLHSGNVLVELDASGRMKKLWVIDFGRYVNIPVGSNEKRVYNTLQKNMLYQNYNLFNNTRKPMVWLRKGPTGVARANYNLAKEMYGIRTLKNRVVNALATTPFKGQERILNEVMSGLQPVIPRLTGNNAQLKRYISRILNGERLS